MDDLDNLKKLSSQKTIFDVGGMNLKELDHYFGDKYYDLNNLLLALALKCKVRQFNTVKDFFVKFQKLEQLEYFLEKFYRDKDAGWFWTISDSIERVKNDLPEYYENIKPMLNDIKKDDRLEKKWNEFLIFYKLCKNGDNSKCES